MRVWRGPSWPLVPVCSRPTLDGITPGGLRSCPRPVRTHAKVYSASWPSQLRGSKALCPCCQREGTPFSEPVQTPQPHLVPHLTLAWAELGHLRAAASLTAPEELSTANMQVPAGPVWSWAAAPCRGWPDGRSCLGSACTVWGSQATGSPMGG